MKGKVKKSVQKNIEINSSVLQQNKLIFVCYVSLSNKVGQQCLME